MKAQRTSNFGSVLTSSIAAFIAFAFAGEVLAGETYYVLVFASQQTPPRPNYSHSFATFVRATWQGDGPCPKSPILEEHTISWLPANSIVRTFALSPECGRNYGLEETLRYAHDNNERVSLWGPHQVDPDLYNRAMRQIALLESGQVRYKANDMGFRTDRVSNCIHAVSSVAEGYRLRVAEPGWGQMASWAIMKRFRPWVIDCDQVHPWVGSALGLDQHPIVFYRDWESPHSGGGVVGSAYRLFGSEKNVRATYGPPR